MIPDQTIIFSQDDPRWAMKHLGTSGFTMRGQGCFDTDTTHALRRYGHDIDPGQLCDQLNAHDGFGPDGLERWSVIEALYPDTLLAASINTVLQPASGLKYQMEVALKMVENAVRLGMIAGLCVDIPGVGNPGESDHIVACDYAPPDRTNWQVKDSDGGIRQKLGAGKYPLPDKAVYGVRLLIGAPIAWPDYSTEYDKTCGIALFYAGQAYKHAREIKDTTGMVQAKGIINALIGL